MNEPQAPSPRRRLQELLSIPDNKKTEAEWDELNELEISLAPVNQLANPEKRQRGPIVGAPVPESRAPRSPRGRKPQVRSPRRAPKAPGP